MTVYKVVSYKRTVRSKIDSRSHDLVLTDLYETEEMCPRKVKLSIKLYKTLKSFCFYLEPSFTCITMQNKTTTNKQKPQYRRKTQQQQKSTITNLQLILLTTTTKLFYSSHTCFAIL